ncbi:MAG: hypothetical protein ACJ741_14965 [Pyrinomonadaceae bacterium]
MESGREWSRLCVRLLPSLADSTRRFFPAQDLSVGRTFESADKS